MDALGRGKEIDQDRDLVSSFGGTMDAGWALFKRDRVACSRAIDAIGYRLLLMKNAARSVRRLNPATLPVGMGVRTTRHTDHFAWGKQLSDRVRQRDGIGASRRGRTSCRRLGGRRRFKDAVQ